MKDGKKRIKAIFIAMCMIVTAFIAVVSLPVGAHEDSDDTDFEIMWVNSWMEDDPNVDPDDEDIMFNFDVANGEPYYLGARDAEIQLLIFNREGNVLNDLYITCADTSTIITDVPTSRWPTAGDYDGYLDDDPIDDDPGDLSYLFDTLPRFTIDIANTGNTNQLHTNALEITINYDPGSGMTTDTFSFDIFVCSIFDDPGDPDSHDPLPDMLETDGTPEGYFEDGENMQEGEIDFTEYAGFDVTDVMTDLDLSGITEDVVLPSGTNIALNPDPGGANFQIYYRVNVGETTSVDPGIYTGQIEIQYVRDDTGDTITEGNRPIDLTVDYTARLVAELENTVTITQGETSADISVRFRNVGNVPLTDLWVWNDEPDAGGDFWDLRFHHYENDDDTYAPQVDIGDLAPGIASSYMPATVATSLRTPNGIHRLPLQWNGWFYENGATGDATRWLEVGGFQWDDDGDESSPMVGLLYEDDNENGMYDGGEPVLEEDWTDIYVEIEVDDQNGLSFKAYLDTTLNAGEMGDVSYTTITVILYNNELVPFKDIFCELAVGPGTPFLNPVDHSPTALPLEMNPNSATTIGAWPATSEIYFTVDVNAAWWQSNALVPGVYMVDMTVDATNDDEEERYEDNNIPVQVAIDGFGPELFTSTYTHGKITPGEKFTLIVSITNYGDDIAREVDAYLRADFISGWTIVDQFVTSISSYGGAGPGGIGDATWGWSEDQYHNYWNSYSTFNRSNNVKPGDIGVDNVPQIVELHDWIKRRESPPQGKILWLHLDRLEPGSNHSFVFEMVSDVNMVEGMIYYVNLDLYYVNSNGETYGPNGAPMGMVEDHYAPPQEILIRTGKGEKYVGQEMDWTIVLYALIFLIIAFIIFLIGYALGGKGKGGESKPDEPAYEPYTSDYSMDDNPEPAPEEDIGPPFPDEDKPPE
jgi:hypothetical protein